MNLYDHQKYALERMHNGCIVNGVPGSGKSLTALCYYYQLYGGNLDIWEKERTMIPMDDECPDLYIITTAKKRDDKDWEKEMTPFLMSTDEELNLYKNKIVVDSWNNIKKYKDVKEAFFIFDEQRVVGKGAWVRSFIQITRNNLWILLSATPGDCWEDYIPVFIANGFYRNRYEFERDHIVWKRFSKFPQIDRYLNVGRLIRLRNSILIDMPYRPQAVRHDIDIHCMYNREEYKRTTKERYDRERDRPFQSASELCYALRRIVNSDKTRLTNLIDILKEKKRVIIFYNFDYEREAIINVLSKHEMAFSEWSGHGHQEIPNEKEWAYLVQYTAGCEGWNCITTDTIVFYSQTYSYKQLEQAKGRTDRLTTPFKDLYYYHFQSSAPIDIAIRKALKQKRNFNEGRFLYSQK